MGRPKGSKNKPVAVETVPAPTPTPEPVVEVAAPEPPKKKCGRPVGWRKPVATPEAVEPPVEQPKSTPPAKPEPKSKAPKTTKAPKTPTPLPTQEVAPVEDTEEQSKTRLSTALTKEEFASFVDSMKVFTENMSPQSKEKYSKVMEAGSTTELEVAKVLVMYFGININSLKKWLSDAKN